MPMQVPFVRGLLIVTLLFSTLGVVAQDSTKKKPGWFERISIRGYVQTRYNRLLETNPQLKCEQCDRSLGEGGGFFIRRARMVLSGQLHPNVYFYFQPDFATASNSGQNFAQIRDAYVDLSVGKQREFRVRIGNSKIPYGFENMQSSSDRIPLDRSDPINSGLANERDVGAIFYYAPGHIRELFSQLDRKNLKHSGDYGVFAFGMYNGQTSNRPEANNNLHKVVRLTYPFKIGDQIIEPSIQAYTGDYTLERANVVSGVKHSPNRTYIDRRVAGTFVLYPQPFGIQAEFNIGEGPEYDVASDSVMVKGINGGYTLFSYYINAGKQVLIPYARAQYYRGGKKHEDDARAYQVHEYELGIEWQPFEFFELVAGYMISQRWTADFSDNNNLQKGQALRLQAQINF